jgi:membrane-associated protease RseP (regulator of RpoE activity)
MSRAFVAVLATIFLAAFVLLLDPGDPIEMESKSIRPSPAVVQKSVHSDPARIAPEMRRASELAPAESIVVTESTGPDPGGVASTRVNELPETPQPDSGAWVWYLPADEDEQVPRIDASLRRRLEELGIESERIDLAESRLRSLPISIPDGSGIPAAIGENFGATGDADAGEGEDPADWQPGRQRVQLDQIRMDMPAGLAGLIDGDQVVRYDGLPIANIDDLRNAIYGAPVARPVIAEVMRDGETFEVLLEPGVLGARLLPLVADD